MQNTLKGEKVRKSGGTTFIRAGRPGRNSLRA